MTLVGTPRTTAPTSAANPASSQRRAAHARSARSRKPALGAGGVTTSVTATATSFFLALHVDGVVVDAELDARQRPRCRSGDDRRATAGVELGAVAGADDQAAVGVEADEAAGVGADRAVGQQLVLGEADQDGGLPRAGQLDSNSSAWPTGTSHR